MVVTVFAVGGAEALVARLGEAGVDARIEALPEPSGAGSAGLIAALRIAEDALEARQPDGVVVAGTDDSALAAALTAVKLQIPTAWVEARDGGGDPVIARVADASIDASAPAED